MVLFHLVTFILFYTYVVLIQTLWNQQFDIYVLYEENILLIKSINEINQAQESHRNLQTSTLIAQ